MWNFGAVNSVGCFTWAYNTGVFIVVTVMFSETFVWAVSEGLLITNTFNIVQPNLILTFSEIGLVLDCNRGPTVQLSACNSCFWHAPFVITNCSPLPIMEDFHSAWAPMGSILQPHLVAVCQMENNSSRTAGVSKVGSKVTDPFLEHFSTCLYMWQ